MILTQIPSNLQIDSLTGWSVVVVIALYLSYSLIEKYMTKRKTTNAFNKILDRLEEQSNINKETMKYLKTVSLGYSEELNEEQYKVFIDKFTQSAEFKIYNSVKRIIIENNLINNKQKVISKIHNYIETLFNSDEIELRNFKMDGSLISNFMDIKWIKILSDGLINNIYDFNNEYDRLKACEYFIKQEFISIKNEFLNKIKQNG